MDKALARRREFLLISMMLTTMLSSMSILLFNFVLPVIREEFALTSSQVSWVTSSYTLIYGIGTAIYGKLADRYKLKHLLTFGLTMFSFASLLGFLSTTYGLLLAARCLQAAGAAAIPATASLVPIRYYPAEKRGRAMGTVFAGVALGNALGPIVSALVVSILEWRWLFAIPLLLLFLLPVYHKFLGDDQVKDTRIDWLGGGLFAAGVAMLLLAVTTQVLWLIGAVIGFVGFVARIRSVEQPFIQPALFRNREYTYYLVLAFLVMGISYSLFFTTPLFLADVYQLPAREIGLVMVPAAAMTALLNRQAGKLADQRGPLALFMIAAVLLFAGYGLLSALIGLPVWVIACLLVLGYVGQSAMSLVMSRSISLSLPAGQAGVGMGLLMMQNFIAGTVAIGVYSRIVDLDAERAWNPLAMAPASGAVYSNLFLVLSILWVAIFIVYYVTKHRLLDRLSTQALDKKGN